MTLEYVNNKISTFYLVSLITLAPYGIPGGANIRLTDLFALLLLSSGFTLLLYGKKISYRILVTPLLLFIFLEFYTPIAGMILYGTSSMTTSIRTILMWMPLILYWGLMDENTNIEKKVDFVLKVGLVINLSIAMMQLLISLGFLPEFLLPTYYLQVFAVDEQYKLYESFRSSGLFVNSTGLALFGTLAFIFYYSRILTGIKNTTIWTFVAFVLVLLTTSRTAVVFMVLVIFLGLFFANIKTKITVSISMTILIGVLLYVVDIYVGLESFFWRFQRVYDSGLLEDVSFGHIINVLWPSALEGVKDLPFGTLSSSPIVLGVIDSGYLTYYTQGKWIFIFSLLYLLFYMFIKIFKRVKREELKWIKLFISFLAFYILLTMVVNNPMRSQIIIVFILLSFMLLEQLKNKEANEKSTLYS
jgi:hypothetical protein